MNEVEFHNWLGEKGVKKKIQHDYVYRLKRLERELNHCDIDEEYRSDKCSHLFKLLEKNGKNPEMEKYPNTKLPIGKYYMSTYRLALKQYIQFIEETNLIP